MKYYSSDKIDKTGAQYRLIIGERSNGKTYCILHKILKNYVEKGEQGAYIRRWDEDVRGRRGNAIFSALVSDKWVSKLTKNRYNSIYFYNRSWFLCKIEDGERSITDTTPFCYAFSLGAMEHDKSTSYPDVTTICFDEFLTRRVYLTDEFVLFMNCISTIVRQRHDVTIYMLANTVNKSSPYFKEMGLSHIKDMKQGTIDTYSYGDSKLKVAVEYCSALNKNGKKSDVYFAFDNPKLNMITSGVWEMALYPHCPLKYTQRDIKFTFFIEFEEEMLQCEIVSKDNNRFIYIHRKSTPLQNPDKDIIFKPIHDPRPNWIYNMYEPIYPFHKKILLLFKESQVYYQDNEIGEIVRNYLNWCKQERYAKI